MSINSLRQKSYLMNKVNDSGNAVNVSNFKLLIEVASSYKLDYKPSNPALTVAALTAKWTTADTSQSLINAANEKATPLIHNREALFAPLNKIITRSLNSFNSIQVLPTTKDSAKSIADSIRGNSKYFPVVVPVKVDPVTKLVIPPDTIVHISTSHQSFVMRVDSLDKYIQLVKQEPLYVPAEIDIAVDGLVTLYTSLKAANQGIGAVLTPVDNARINRNEALYNTTDGIFELQKLVKNYVISLYGEGTDKTRMVTKIKFTKHY